MNGSSWATRAAARIDTWPVGPIAGLMLGGATAFFCWAVQVGLGGTTAATLVPGALVGALTWTIFRLIDARAAENGALRDEGDDQEDWLTAPSPYRHEPIPAPEGRAVRPLTIAAIAEYVPPVAAPAPLPGVVVGQMPAELLLESVVAYPERPMAAPAAPVTVLMDRLAVRMTPPHPAPDDAGQQGSPECAEDAELRAALAGLHRMAAQRG